MNPEVRNKSRRKFFGPLIMLVLSILYTKILVDEKLFFAIFYAFFLALTLLCFKFL